MTEDAAEETLNDEDQFAANVLQSYWDIFWNPEISRRGGPHVVGTIWKALAILAPGEPAKVLFNDEVTFVARMRANSPINPGDVVTVDTVDMMAGLEPCDIDPNAGWAAYAVLPDGHQYASFDFRRNRERSLALLDLAREFIATAAAAIEAGNVRPALENAMAAAELAITAQTHSMEAGVPGAEGKRNSHGNRLHWTRHNVEHGNTTLDAHTALVELNQARRWARYGQGGPGVSRARSKELLESVTALVGDAALRVGPRLPILEPEFRNRIVQAQSGEST